MEYELKTWRLTTADQVTITRETRFACPGPFLTTSAGCAARPNHVVTYTDNPSSFPGLGTGRTVTPCYRHLHAVLKHAETTGVYALVTEYKGI